MGLKHHPPIRLKVLTHLKLSGLTSFAFWYSFEQGESPEGRQWEGLSICDWHQIAANNIPLQSIKCLWSFCEAKNTVLSTVGETTKRGDVVNAHASVLAYGGLHQEARGCMCFFATLTGCFLAVLGAWTPTFDFTALCLCLGVWALIQRGWLLFCFLLQQLGPQSDWQVGDLPATKGCENS